MINFNPFPVIETQRLVLRHMSIADAEDVFRMRSDPRMHEHTDTQVDVTLEQTNTYIEKMDRGINENRWIIWAIEHKDSGKFAGTVSIWNFDNERRSGELGYGIIPSFQGQGLMTEALDAVVRYGFDIVNLNVIEAYTEVSNARSNCLLERCKFIRTKEIKEAGYVKNILFNMAVYIREK
jgi:ribosomal-protein-alanine N-acetyltransferase